MLSLSNSWGKYRTQTPIKSCATSVAATAQITVLLAIKILFLNPRHLAPYVFWKFESFAGQ